MLAKRIEVQRAQYAIMDRLTETKEFNKITETKNSHKDSTRR